MDYPLLTRLIAEFFGTLLLVLLGNGAVANVDLVKSKGNKGGWILIALGYGMGVMLPAMIFGTISGNHINPAFTIGLAMINLFPMSEVVPYILAQLLGAIVGQILVVGIYKPHYDVTDDHGAVLGTFATSNVSKSCLNGFITEVIGTFVLIFCALGITSSQSNPKLDALALGFLVMTLVISLGGTTGPALNPARDLGPRLVHIVLPLKHKGSADLSYAWVPILAPLIGGVTAAECWKLLFS